MNTTMNTQADNSSKVLIEKRLLTALIDEAEGVLQYAGKTVGSTISASDNLCEDESPRHRDEDLTMALKDAARCYDRVALFIEQMKLDFATASDIQL